MNNMLKIIRALRIASRINNSTSGSILFIDSNNLLAEDNANLFWDDVNKRLGIGTITPNANVDILGNFNANPDNVSGALGLGTNVIADGTDSVAVGRADAGGNMSVAVGDGSIASGLRSVALGPESEASGSSSFAMGNNAEATNTAAIAIGNAARASENRSLAIGQSTLALHEKTIVIGPSTRSSQINQMTVGATGVAGQEYQFRMVGSAATTIFASKELLAFDGTWDDAILATLTSNVDLKKYQNGSLVIFMTFAGDGSIGINTLDPLAKLQITTPLSTDIGQIIKSAAAQSADLKQYLKSDDTLYSGVNNIGERFQIDDVKNWFGTGFDASIYYDGTDLIVDSQEVGTGSIYLKNGQKRTIQRNTTTATIDTTAYQWNGNTDGGSFVYTLPAGIQDQQYKIVNTGTSGYQLTITPDGADTLIGVNSSFILNDGESLIIGYDSTDGWY